MANPAPPKTLLSWSPTHSSPPFFVFHPVSQESPYSGMKGVFATNKQQAISQRGCPQQPAHLRCPTLSIFDLIKTKHQTRLLLGSADMAKMSLNHFPPNFLKYLTPRGSLSLHPKAILNFSTRRLCPTHIVSYHNTYSSEEGIDWKRVNT